MKTNKQLHHVNAWEQSGATGSSLVTASGNRILDELLPAGGWPKHGLMEIMLPDAWTDGLGLLLPALSRLSRQRRWITLVNPTYTARASLYTAPAIRHERVLQVNPHPGRSALWTVESLLHAGECSVVMAWPSCRTELMGKRLQRAAEHGRALGILFTYAGLEPRASGVDLRLRLECGAEGQAVYLLNGRGDTLAGEVI